MSKTSNRDHNNKDYDDNNNHDDDDNDYHQGDVDHDHVDLDSVDIVYTRPMTLLEKSFVHSKIKCFWEVQRERSRR